MAPASMDGALSEPLFRKSGDENHGYAMPFSDQLVLQLQAVEAGHLEVGYEARCCREAPSSAKILR